MKSLKSYYRLFKELPTGIKLAIAYLLIVGLIALFADFIANDIPVLIDNKGQVEWPIKNRSLYLSKSNSYDPHSVIISAPVKFYATTLDQSAGLVKPGQRSEAFNGAIHWLGTDTYSRDVLAGIIHGSKIAIWVGLISSIISCLIGLVLGSLAGYYQDHKLIINKFIFVGLLLSILILAYVCWWNKGLLQFFRVDLLCIGLVISLLYLNTKYPANPKNSVSFPVDSIVMKSIEIFQSIPGLFLLIALISLFQSSSVFKLSIIISLLRWPSFTRLVRGETLKIKATEYIQSARALGIFNYNIIIRHIWPNLFRQLLVAFSYGVGSAVLLEASLSFLGLGLPPDSVSWGSLLSQSRFQVSAWWLALFPGLMITLLIASSYKIGNYLIKDKDRRENPIN